jgi:hypothetical protein
VAYLLAHGRWPNPCALHACDNQRCVKAVADEHGPAHIFEGSLKDNSMDMASKGRAGPKSPATGHANGTYTHPECTVRGEQVNTAKLRSDQVIEIRAALRRGEKQNAIARRYGVGTFAIWAIAGGRTWKHV